MTEESKIELLTQGTQYHFPIVTGTHKGKTASLTLAPKLGANLSIKSENHPGLHFKSLKGASKTFKTLTNVDVQALPPMTKGQFCKCGKQSRPTNVTNLRSSGEDKESLRCLRCGGKVRRSRK